MPANLLRRSLARMYIIGVYICVITRNGEQSLKRHSCLLRTPISHYAHNQFRKLTFPWTRRKGRGREGCYHRAVRKCSGVWAIFFLSSLGEVVCLVNDSD